MPTNANTFNSRVTSEALEAKFRQVFPSQGGAELVQDLFASGVIVPVVDFSTVAEGSVLAPNLQTAWDFSTGYTSVSNTSSTAINNTGFWQVDLNASSPAANANAHELKLELSDGITTKTVWEWNVAAVPTASVTTMTAVSNSFVVFLRTGDSLIASTDDPQAVLDVWYRQIADVNGNLVNPLGFTFT